MIMSGETCNDDVSTCDDNDSTDKMIKKFEMEIICYK